MNKKIAYTSLYASILFASQQGFALELEQELAQQWQMQQQNQRIAQLESYRTNMTTIDESQFTSYESINRAGKKTNQPATPKPKLVKNVTQKTANNPTQPLPSKTRTSVNANTVCSAWQTVELFGLELIKPKYAEGLKSQAAFLSQQAKQAGCLPKADLQRLSQKVTLAFVQAGYFKTKLTQKTVLIESSEPTKNTSLNTNNNTNEKKLALYFSPANITSIENNTALSSFNLFGDAADKPANIKDIDQALDQANRLPNHKVGVDIYPQNTGDVALKLTDTIKDNWVSKKLYGLVSLDSFGDTATNRLRGQILLGVANPLGMADKLSITALTTAPKKETLFITNNKSKTEESLHSFNNSLAINYDVPIGYWSFGLFGSQSKYKNKVQLTKNQLTQQGKSWQGGIRVNKVVSRSAKHISTLSTSLSHSEKKSWFGGSFIGTQSPNINELSLGYNHTQLIENGVISANLNYHYGQSNLKLVANSNTNTDSSTNKTNGNNTSNIKDNFNIYAASIQAQQVFPAQVFSQKDLITVSARLFGSYADSMLPSGKRHTVNTQYSVRGGFNYGVSADSYIALQNTLAIKTIPFPTASPNFKISPYFGLDVARAYKRLPNSANVTNISNGTEKKQKKSHQYQDVGAYLLGVKTQFSDIEANIFASKAVISNTSPLKNISTKERKQIQEAKEVQINAVLTWRF